MKTFYRQLIKPAGVALLVAASIGFAQAQEISASHIAAARKAIAAVHATDPFDNFLPSTARDLKNELVRKDPNLEAVISDTVDTEALSLAKRRGDLETEAARAYAKHFSEQELNAIAAFYESDAGKKLLSKGPVAMNDAVGAFNVWSQAVAQELATNVGKALVEKIGAAKAPQLDVVPAAPEAPKTPEKPAAPTNPSDPK